MHLVELQASGGCQLLINRLVKQEVLEQLNGIQLGLNIGGRGDLLQNFKCKASSDLVDLLHIDHTILNGSLRGV